MKTDDNDVLSHVTRAGLPWREAKLTECGLPIESHRSISADEFDERVKRLGQQRAAMLTCMTCWSTAHRYDPDRYGSMPGDFAETWALLNALEREISWSRRKDRVTFPRELAAIGILIERHRSEFDEIIADAASTVPISAARTRKDGKQ